MRNPVPDAANAKNLLSTQTCVHLMRIDRSASRHEFSDWSVDVLLSASDSAQASDSEALQATVTALAGQSESESMEGFAQELMERLLYDHPRIARAEVTLTSHLWKRLVIDGDPSPTAYMKGSDERQTTHVVWSQTEPFTIRSGFANMTVFRTSSLETTEGPFVEEAAHAAPEHGLLHTAMTATWQYKDQASFLAIDFNKIRSRLRERCLATFARQGCQPLQKTLQEIAEAAMNEVHLISEITLRMQSLDLSMRNVSPSTKHTRHIVIPAEISKTSLEITLCRA